MEIKQPICFRLGPLLPIVESRVNEARDVSSLMRSILERYDVIVKRSMPLLTVNEWCLIFDALNGTWLLDNAGLVISAFPVEISDAIRLNGADSKWGVDGSSLMAKINAMTPANILAAIDAAERFWVQDVQPVDGEFTPLIVGLVGRIASERDEAAAAEREGFIGADASKRLIDGID